MNELDLFIAANAISDPAERAAYLERVCANQPELRQRLEALLAGNSQSRHPLEQPPSHPQAAVDDATLTHGDPASTGTFRSAPSAEEAEGTIIAGRYKLRQQIGEGGMGTVWMADQTEPVKRKVAVKLIRVERGQSKTILARFEAERQAIALMDHPHIAKLLDAGTTETGSPFFVMELVRGIPLNDYCDQHRLTIADRLNLFTQICSAVQHAHQKGIIHRDLKPGNILVESHDGKPVPKVIDFGLAKATTGLQLTEQSMFTAFGSVMGTPLYMAPEQASFNAVDVDTRADVYALGVVLYELLTGTTPLTKETMKKAALDEMLQLIREQEAPTPSSRLSSPDSTPSVAASRQIEPQKLGRFVKGELDWIVLKALSKDRDRRYETPNGFAKDIERFLNHEPVTAGPPSARYRLQKFVRRNRGQVIAASLVLFALVAGMAGTTWQWIDATNQRNKAETAEALAKENESKAEDERKKATDEAQKAKLARGVAVEESKRADRQRLEAETAKYAMQVQLAEIHYEKFELPAAHNLLDETKPDLRNWEYDLVKQRCDERMQFFGKNRAYIAVAITPDGKLVAGGGRGGTVELFDYDTGKLIAEWKENGTYVLKLSFSPDGKRLACATETTMCVWDVETRKELGKLEFPAPAAEPGRTNVLGKYSRSIAFDAAGNRLALGLEEEIQIWDTTLSKKHRTIKTEPGKVRAIAFDPIRDRIAVRTSPPQVIKLGAGIDDVLSIYNPGSGELHQKISIMPANVPFIAYDPQGQWLLTPGLGEKNPLMAWDPETGKAVESPLSRSRSPDDSVGKSLSALAFNASGSRVALGSFMASDSIYVLDGKTGKLERSPRMPTSSVAGMPSCSINGIDMSADGKRIVVATSSMFTGIGLNDFGRLVGVTIDGDASIANLKSNIRGRSVPWSLGLTPSNQSTICEQAGWIARPISYTKHSIGESIDYDGTKQTAHFLVEFLSLTTGELLFCLRRNDRSFGRIVANHDGQSLLELNRSTIEVWDPQTRRRTRTIQLENSSDQVIASLFSPDDTLLATVEGQGNSADEEKQRQRLVVRDFRTGKVLWQTESSSNTLEPRDFSADSSRLLTGTTRPPRPKSPIRDPITGDPTLDFKVKMKVLDARTGKVLAEPGETIPILSGGRFVAPDRVWFTTMDGLYSWDTASGEAAKISDQAGSLLLIRNGTRMIVRGRDMIRVLDVATMQEVYRLREAHSSDQYTVLPSGNCIMIVGSNGEAKLLNIRTAKQQ